MKEKLTDIHFTKAFIPNGFTALNLITGFLVILFASDGRFDLAVILIFVAAFFDALDGFIARWLKTSSPFGLEIDSLADVVSFGVAPAYLIYKTHFFGYGVWGIVVAAIFLICGAFRLARFNIFLKDLDNKPDFQGLPIPVAAQTLAGFVYTFDLHKGINPALNIMLVLLVFLVSILMVTNIKYRAMPRFKQIDTKRKIFIIAFVVLGTISLFITQGNSIFYIFLSIVLFGIFRHAIEGMQNNGNSGEETEN